MRGEDCMWHISARSCGTTHDLSPGSHPTPSSSVQAQPQSIGRPILPLVNEGRTRGGKNSGSGGERKRPVTPNGHRPREQPVVDSAIQTAWAPREHSVLHPSNLHLVSVRASSRERKGWKIDSGTFHCGEVAPPTNGPSTSVHAIPFDSPCSGIPKRSQVP